MMWWDIAYTLAPFVGMGLAFWLVWYCERR